MQNVLITGAAGDIGTRLRKILRGVYPHIRASDIRKPADLGAGDDFVPADLTDLTQVEKAVAGIEGIVHLGGHAVEGSWETILNANIIGCYNLFEAARRGMRCERLDLRNSGDTAGDRSRVVGYGAFALREA